jgi:hypothetical protein
MGYEEADLPRTSFHPLAPCSMPSPSPQSERAMENLRTSSHFQVRIPHSSVLSVRFIADQNVIMSSRICQEECGA